MHWQRLPQPHGGGARAQTSSRRNYGLERRPLPLGYIAAPTRAVLAEIDASCDGQTSKPLLPADLYAADLIVNMTGQPAKNLFDDCTLPVEDWDVGDPFGSDLAVYRRIRDEIEQRIVALALRLRAATVPQGS